NTKGYYIAFLCFFDTGLYSFLVGLLSYNDVIGGCDHQDIIRLGGKSGKSNGRGGIPWCRFHDIGVSYPLAIQHFFTKLVILSITDYRYAIAERLVPKHGHAKE